MEDLEITQPWVQRLVESLKVHKAAGPDEIGPSTPKEHHQTHKTYLFKWSYETGKVPGEWWTAHMIPIHKPGHKHHVGSYRHILLA